ncbi:ribonuclease HII [Candidatus Nesciobacter abundans]|uniref:Ribonuclease n=1 Tax=Candidatus Nesciobacter abundans TaxID=2601668 RepID=A0A5C0UHA4_9PROT|nr:ribonuclease HII [Candidatus Nesciobacter abundans]QEK39120.1 ribonuclease HII [Candidatus Nesciobacter abundans]
MNTHKNILYIDEVGYGPIAGPVVCCGILGKHIENFPIQDSKMLSKKKRHEILGYLFSKHIWSIGWADPQEIDLKGIRKATDNSFQRAILNISRKYKIDKIIIDGKYKPKLDCTYLDLYNNERNLKDIKIESLIKGDCNNIYISHASIIAKEMRDFCMKKVDQPFLWQKNSGYGTAEHLLLIKKFSTHKMHRRSYNFPR